MAVFNPNKTTEVLIKAVKDHGYWGHVLDLGCGSGEVAKSLLKEGVKMYASDISQEAIDNINDNRIDKRCGSLFSPWQHKEFDVIVDDVSGVAHKIAKISPWFNEVPCDSGDGSDLLIKVLEQAPKHLNPNGKLFFPIVSLSNVKRALDKAQEIYKLELLSHNEFPLPKEMYKHLDLICKCEGVKMKEKFGILLFWSDIYLARTKGA